ncbi:MAG: LLM class flavin-dependent oxidoreductase [Dehalococcoidia bacterium]|nr:LLM class flavin-dependent oxidoreductase [Dehalococcoidia bacterium]
MKIGMMLPNYARWFRGERILATCEKGKELGLDAFSFVDHVMMTPRQYVGMGNGYMDIWTAMTYVAAVTNMQGWKPILTQSVCVIPYRPPIQQAKVAATLDSLSGGRLIVGAGSGYNELEFRDLGMNSRERGERADEYLACMKELWSNPVTSFHGKYVNFDERTISVRPAQQPHPPILYGSRGPRPRRRVAERYQGAIDNSDKEAEGQRAFESDMADLNRLWKERGRSGKPFIMVYTRGHLTTDRGHANEQVSKGVVTAGIKPVVESGGSHQALPEGQERPYVSTYTLTHVSEMVEDLRRLESAGVDLAIVWLPSYRYGQLDNLGLQTQQMELLAEHVLPKVHRDKRPIEMDFGGKSYTPLVLK